MNKGVDNGVSTSNKGVAAASSSRFHGAKIALFAGRVLEAKGNDDNNKRDKMTVLHWLFFTAGDRKVYAESAERHTPPRRVAAIKDQAIRRIFNYFLCQQSCFHFFSFLLLFYSWSLCYYPFEREMSRGILDVVVGAGLSTKLPSSGDTARDNTRFITTPISFIFFPLYGSSLCRAFLHASPPGDTLGNDRLRRLGIPRGRMFLVEYEEKDYRSRWIPYFFWLLLVISTSDSFDDH